MRRAMLSMLVVAILAMVSCSVIREPQSGPAPGEAVASEKRRVTSLDVTDAEINQVAQGNNAFAFDLYRFLMEQQEDDNLFYSLYSVSLALAMTYAGARGETQEQMADVLHFVLPQDQLHPAFNALDQELAQRGEGAEGRDEAEEEDSEGFRLNIANSIWGQKGYQFLDTFLDVLAENYGAGLRLVDFAAAPEESRVKINEWVSEQTEGKIENLIPPDLINSLTRLVLTNAIYFNAAWSQPFEGGLTSDGTFYLLDGAQVQVPMMHQTASFGYVEGEVYQAVELPYDGRELSMVILLPPAGQLAALEASLDAELLEAIVGDLEETQVALTMPRFEFDSSFELAKILADMGMPDAFSGQAADFSGINGTRNLFISAVVHKAFVSVDEAGTEAAAATAVIMAEEAPPAPAAEVTVDRPFVFLIRDIQTGTILFVGRVADPSA